LARPTAVDAPASRSLARPTAVDAPGLRSLARSSDDDACAQALLVLTEISYGKGLRTTRNQCQSRHGTIRFADMIAFRYDLALD